jgi:hypothetical protein
MFAYACPRHCINSTLLSHEHCRLIAGDRWGDVLYLIGGWGKRKDPNSGKLRDGERKNGNSACWLNTKPSWTVTLCSATLVEHWFIYLRVLTALLCSYHCSTVEVKRCEVTIGAPTNMDVGVT